MNWKKIFAAVSFAVTLPTVTFAHGELWYDADSYLPKFKKIAVYPITWLNSDFLIDTNGESDVYQANNYFEKRFVRKLKITTVPLGVPSKENEAIRGDKSKYEPLYSKFSSEQDRAKKVTEITGSDGYAMSHIYLDKLEPHLSPAKTVNVQMKSWTEDTGGPNGNKTYDEKTWNVSHTIPAKELMLYHFGVDYNIFDRDGKKIMTYRNAEHTYANDFSGISGIFGSSNSIRPENYALPIFKSLVNEYRKDFEEIKKNFDKDKKKSRISKTLGFKGINLPNNVGSDEYSLKSVYFIMKNFALQFTNAKIDYDGSGNAKYFVQGTLNRYSLDRNWVEPHVTLSNRLISSEKHDWYDNEGNKHTRSINKYQTEITDHHGYWQYTATVAGNFNLIDSNGKIFVSHSATETDDKTADAYRHLMENFYKKVNNFFTGK